MAENIDIKQLIDGNEVFYPQTDINALVNNGEYAIDDVPVIDSSNLVRSDGVASELALGAVYDVTAHNGGAQFASLQALLTDPNLNTLIPTNIRRGGMSIKFIQTDNTYVRYRLLSDEFTTDTSQWTIAEDGVYTENPEFVYVKTDAEDKILLAIKADGTFYFGAGCPPQVMEHVQDLDAKITTKVDKEEGKSLIDAEYADGVSHIENPEFIKVVTDNEDRIIYAITVNGGFYFGAGVPQQIIEYVTEHIDVKVDKEEGKSLIDEGVAASQSVIEDPEDRHEITLDAEERIVSYRKPDGTKVENVGIETNKLTLTDSGMTEFQQALKDSGFRPGGAGDYSDTITEKGKKPVFIPTPRLARVNIIWDGNLSNLSKSDRSDGVQKVNYDVKVPVEFFDGQGVYFKKYALMSAQGNSSMAFEKKNISLKFFDTEDVEGKKKKWGKGDTFGTVFGDWVM